MLMEICSKVNFWTTKCMARENLLGQMDANTQVLIKMIRNMVKAFLNGHVASDMKDNGKMTNNTVLVKRYSSLEKKQRVNGLKVRRLNEICKLI